MAAQSTAVNVTGTGAANAGPCTLRGFWIFSVAGATVTIYDNASAASGTVLAAFVLTANQYAWLDASDGVHCVQGVYVSVTAGTIIGNVRIG